MYCSNCKCCVYGNTVTVFKKIIKRNNYNMFDLRNNYTIPLQQRFLLLQTKCHLK